jgi:hypothetical protein
VPIPNPQFRIEEVDDHDCSFPLVVQVEQALQGILAFPKGIYLELLAL